MYETPFYTSGVAPQDDLNPPLQNSQSREGNIHRKTNADHQENAVFKVHGTIGSLNPVWESMCHCSRRWSGN